MRKIATQKTARIDLTHLIENLQHWAAYGNKAGGGVSFKPAQRDGMIIATFNNDWKVGDLLPAFKEMEAVISDKGLPGVSFTCVGWSPFEVQIRDAT